jgi:malonyl-CoA/methylmalonyl-CoA synthetase
MFLPDLFALSLAGQHDIPGIDFDAADGRVISLTFGEIDLRARRLSAVLAGRGLRTGDRLGLYLGNRIEYIDLFLACLQLGVIIVPINVLYREREVAHIVGDSAPSAVVTTVENAAVIPAGTPAWDVDELARAAEEERATPRHPRLDGDTAAAIVYTSGTTGRSKGAILTHNNFAANAVNLVTSWRMTASDRYLAVLPLFHVHGLGNGVCSWLVSGCRMRLVERFDLKRAAQLFGEFRPTVLFGVPTIYVRLLELDDVAARRIGSDLRLCVCGSAPLPARVMEAFEQKFGQIILERYGMSETLMNIGNPYALERRPGSVGVPFPGVSVRIVAAEGADVGIDEVGELEVRGPNVFAGYWRNPQATVAAFREGWFRTGDLAQRSADGYYSLRGRGSDLIISGGFNIYPREIEELLLEQPGVREAVVVGVPDERRGEVPVAYLVGDTSVQEDGLRDACRRALASFKVPRAFLRVEALPRTALGKIQKHLLPPMER